MEWKEVRLGDVCDLIAGFAFKAKDFGEFPTKVIKIGDIKPPFVDYVGQVGVDISNYDINRLSKYTVKYGDYVLAMTGATIGKVGKYISENFSYINQRVLKFSPKQNVDADFINYIICSNIFAKYVVNFVDSESAQPNISAPTISKFAFQIPSEKDDQHRIASILSSLDRKIELNNKINADLEEMAQAIFKNWFVDFEPFKNGKFVDSELGMIPEGWKVVTLDDLISKFGTGLNPRKNFVLGHGNNYYVTIKNMGNNRIYLNDRCDKVDDEALAKINKRSKLQKGDLLFSGIGTIGRVAMVVDDPINWNTSESVFNMHPIDTVSSEFIYLLLLSDKFQQYVQQNAQGGVQQGIRMASLKAFQFAIPNDLKLFDNLVKPIISKVKSNDKENDTLSLLRDTLLPRLMSGEIEVPE